LEDLGRNATKRKMVVLSGRRSKVLPTIARPCRGRRIPRGADAPLGTVPGSSLTLLAPTHGATTRRASTPRRWTRLGARTALGRAG
jgi:hypothetical protein